MKKVIGKVLYEIKFSEHMKRVSYVKGRSKIYNPIREQVKWEIFNYIKLELERTF